MKYNHEFKQLLSDMTEQIASKFSGKVDGQTKYEIAMLLQDVFELGVEKGQHEALSSIVLNAQKNQQQHADEIEEIFEKYKNVKSV